MDNKMLRKFAALTISLITLFLVGCAGDSGSGSDGNTNRGDSDSNSGSDTENSGTKNIPGSAFKFVIDKEGSTSVTLDSNTNINQIIVNGEVIDISPPSGVSDEEFVMGKDGVYSGTNYKDSRFGLIKNDSVVYLYAQGNITDSSSMPTTGTASYAGTAIVSILNAENQRGASNADAAFNVNFADKTLTGSITSTQLDLNLALSADINSSTFSGTSSDSTTINGQFNGTGASELSGTLTNTDSGVYGAFGAVKQ